MMAQKDPVFIVLEGVLKGLEDEAIIIQNFEYNQGVEETTKPDDRYQTFEPNGVYELRIKYARPQMPKEPENKLTVALDVDISSFESKLDEAFKKLKVIETLASKINGA